MSRHTTHQQFVGQLPAGRVRLVSDERYTIVLEDGGDVITKRAASCLLSPVPGDRVLLTMSPEPFILAVLERDATKEAVLSTSGDMRVKVDGKLTLEGQQGVEIRSAGLVGFIADAVRVQSHQVELSSQMLKVVADVASSTFRSASVVSRRLDRVAERITEKAARVYRTVTEVDQLRAGDFDHRAEGMARISADATFITARTVMKVNGEQVHIG